MTPLTPEEREAMRKWAGGTLRLLAERDALADSERAARKAYEYNLATANKLRTDAARYRRLQVLGCAPYTWPSATDHYVLRFSNLDEFVDADIAAHPSRGEPSNGE